MINAIFEIKDCLSQAQREKASACRAGAYQLLVSLFGATRANMDEGDTDIIWITFIHKSADGMSEETRKYKISASNSPEENMAIIAAARQQQAWYQTLRTDAQAVPPPAKKAVLVEVD